MKTLLHHRLVFLLPTLIVVSLSVPAQAVTLVCTNSGNWADALIWSPNQIPGATDAASIASGFTVAITNASTAASLTLGGNATLTGTSPLTVGAFVFSSGALAGSGDVTVTGALTWSGGAMTGSGRTIIAVGGTLTMNNTTHDLGRILQFNVVPLFGVKLPLLVNAPPFI